MVNRLCLVNALRAVFVIVIVIVIVHQQSPIAINHAVGILTLRSKLTSDSVAINLSSRDN